MTLGLALACQDGIVMASDSQVTMGEVRRTFRKISQIGESTLWVASGAVGFIQKVEEAIDAFPEEQRRGLAQLHKPLLEALRTLRTDALNQWKRMHSVYDPDAARHRAPGCDILLAGFIGDRPKILHIGLDCEDEWVEKFEFGATGFGTPFAHALLEGFNISALDILRGSLLAFRVLKHAIAVVSFGLGEPIDVWVIQQVGGKPQVRRLESVELAAIGGRVHDLGYC